MNTEFFRLDLVLWGVALALLAICVIGDVKTRRISNRWLVASIPVSLYGSMLVNGIAPGLISSAIGASLALVVMLAIAIGTRGIGGGDIKMGAAVGLLVGWPGAIIAIVVAWISAGMFGAASKEKTMPMAPFLLAGAIAGLVVR